MTEGVIGLRTLLKVGDGATPEVFTAIAEVKDITGPGLSREFAEFTHQQSSGGYREYKPTFKNSGDVTFKCNFLPYDETQAFSTSGLLRDYEDGTLRNFEKIYLGPSPQNGPRVQRCVNSLLIRREFSGFADRYL